MSLISKLLSLTLCLGVLTLAAQQSQDRIYYINAYNKIAIEEMHRTGIPASIKLAQAILESNAGKSALATKANNHFGIKCGSSWSGKTMYREDDDYDSKGNKIASCFRAYKNPESSFIAHSEFLTNRGKKSRYDFLFDFDPTDYKKWAHGLKKAGYATNPKYPQLLIKIIQDYALDTYDTSSPFADPPLLANNDDKKNKDRSKDKNKVRKNLRLKINDVDMIYASAGETPQDISSRINIPVKRILKYNEELFSAHQNLSDKYRVYLQPKRSSFRGRQKTHRVKNGETLMAISQHYGVKLEKLHTRNRIPFNSEPVAGSIIKLKGSKVKDGQGPKVNGGKKNTIPTEEKDDFFDEEIIATTMSDFDIPKNSGHGGTSTTNRPDFKEKTPEPVTTTSTSTGIPKNKKDEIPVEKIKEIESPKKESSKIDRELFYTVSAGDTLYRISKKFNLSVNQIKEKNNLDSNHLNIGQILIVN